MSEDEWLACAELDLLLEAIGRRNTPWTWSTRKARLFACACCRRAAHLLTYPADQHAIELAERNADKCLRLRALESTHREAHQVPLGVSPPGGNFYVSTREGSEFYVNPIAELCTPKAWGDPEGTANDVRALVRFRCGSGADRREMSAQCNLLRDIVGIRPTLPTLNPAWIAWNDNTIPKLAQTIYDERELPSGHLDTGRLAILADALEDAGCTDADILSHCRSPGPHVRGCWVVDLLLAKE